MLKLIAHDLYANDEILANQNLDLFSLDPKHRSDQFDLFSDRKATKFADYDLSGSSLKLVPGKNCKLINFHDLKDLLLSKDNARQPELDALLHGSLKFLSSETKPPLVAFASFPRSGNTFLRKYLENITGIYTGADLPADADRDL